MPGLSVAVAAVTCFTGVVALAKLDILRNCEPRGHGETICGGLNSNRSAMKQYGCVYSVFLMRALVS